MITQHIIAYIIFIQRFLNASVNDLVLPEEQDLEGVPKFVVQPKPFYYIKSDQPVMISCVADPVSHANIICAGKQYSYMGRPISDTGLIVTKFNKNNKVDSQGTRWNISLIIDFKSVSEWFSKYECICEAWNQIAALGRAKKVLSQSTIILESYFHSYFKKVPVSQNLVLDQKLILNCVPPDAKPAAFVTWFKNEKPINEANFPHIKIQDHSVLIIDNVTESDQGRYCCNAQSLDVIRRSPCGEINVIRNFLDQFENVIYIALSILIAVLFLIFLIAVFSFRRKSLLKKTREQNKLTKVASITFEPNDENLYNCHSISSSTDCMMDENRSFSNQKHKPTINRNKIESETLVPFSSINSTNMETLPCFNSPCLSAEGRDVELSIFNSPSTSPTQSPINNFHVLNDSIYNVLTTRSNNSFDGMAWGTFSSIGGHLEIPESSVSLFIPRGAIGVGVSQRIFLTVSRCSSHKPLLNENEALLSPVVICGPEFVNFEKYVILTLPHNAVTSYNQWQIKLLYSKYTNTSESSDWEILSASNNNDYSQQVYIHMMREKACIMLKSLDMYCLVGQSAASNSSKASILIKIISFSDTFDVDSNNFTIRVYTIPNTKEALESIYFKENRSGGQFLNCSQVLNFMDNRENLVLRINEISKGWKVKQTPQTQLIKFSIVWKSHDSIGILNRFYFEKTDQSQNSISCSLVAYQNGHYSNRLTLELASGKNASKSDLIRQRSIDKVPKQDTTIYPFVHPIFENFSLSNQTKKELSKLLNMYDPSGNDWRLLAREMQILKTDFFLKENPTDSLLNLWQAQNSQKSYLKDLMMIFQRHKRFDCVSVLEKYEGYRL